MTKKKREERVGYIIRPIDETGEVCAKAQQIFSEHLWSDLAWHIWCVYGEDSEVFSAYCEVDRAFIRLIKVLNKRFLELHPEAEQKKKPRRSRKPVKA